MNDNNFETLISNYFEWLENENLNNTTENIKNYVIGLHYDIVDNISTLKKYYCIPDSITEIEIVNYIEHYIELLLKEYMKGNKNYEQEK